MNRTQISMKPLLTLFYILISMLQLSAQQSVTATSGGNLQGKNIDVSFTLGETVIQTLVKPNSLVTQGFQQSNLIVTAIDQFEGLAIKIEAYPNPVTDEIKLVMDKELPTDVSYSLYDIQGVLISSNKLDGLLTRVSFQGLVPANYLLRVNQGTKSLKTFKIIKK